MRTRRAVGIGVAADAVLVGVLVVRLQEQAAGEFGGTGRRTAQEHLGDWRSQR